MNSQIYQILEHQARLKCGDLWNLMNDNERLKAILKISISMLKDCFENEKGGK